MRMIFYWLCMALAAGPAYAQQAPVAEGSLDARQKWLLERARAFFEQGGSTPETRLMLSNYRKLLKDDVFCRDRSAGQLSLRLQGSRINEASASVEWVVTGEEKNAVYLLERRFHTASGEFDSVGIFRSRGGSPPLTRYHFTDHNDHPGVTWYRVRLLGGTQPLLKLVKVEGYTNQIKVSPNPASGAFMVELARFKLHLETSLVIFDASGHAVYTLPRAFASGLPLLRIPDLKLAKGSYHLRVSNRFNQGSASFLVQ